MSNSFEPSRVLIVGTGLIGTSIALALTKTGVEVGLSDRDPAAVRAAERLGAGRPHPETPGASVPGYDVAVLAVPPNAVADVLAGAQRRGLARWYTDVASVKTLPTRRAAEAGCELATFVPGHPMAGRERSGPGAATADLFRGRPWALCPTPDTRPAALGAVTALVRACGAIPRVVDAVAHDRAVALVSHAPHVVSAAMAARLASAPEHQVSWSGTGIADVTRKADGDPALWLEILTANPGPVAEVLEEVARDLTRTARSLRAEARVQFPGWTAVEDLLRRGRTGRARIPAPPAPRSLEAPAAETGANAANEKHGTCTQASRIPHPEGPSMVIVMAPEATEQDIQTLLTLIRDQGGEAFVSRGVNRTIVGLVGDVDRFQALNLRSRAGVLDVVRISAPYKLVSREHHPDRSMIRVGSVPIGPDTLTVIAGPCAVESPEQMLAAAQLARRAGAGMLRGGAFKPRTSPYAFQGLGESGLRILADVRAETGLPVVTEVVDPASVDLVASYADMLQIGARNMQNFALLQAVGSAGRPVLLKRGFAATIQEWLMAAEYIAQRGNLDIVLCERGIRTFDPSTRNTLDISAVPVAQALSHLPVIVDPSHSGGRRDLVLPLSRAAIAVGADGIIVDVHPNPAVAQCDGDQALTGEDVDAVAESAAMLGLLMGRSVSRAELPIAV